MASWGGRPNTNTWTRTGLALIASLLIGLDGLPQPGPGCDTDEHRGFDFLLGTWNVQSKDDASSGTVEVKKLPAGCGIEELWTSPSGRVGRSFNVYSSTDGKWHQTYVDTSGTVLLLEGGFVDGAMILLDPDDATPRNRFSWRPLDNGSVLQRWERSDSPKIWTMQFEATWRPVGRAIPEPMEPFAALVGEWDVTPIQQDETGTWTKRPTTRAQTTLILDGKFVEERAILDLPVGRVEYVLLLGYDPFEEVYRLSWNDSLAGLADIYEGSIDEDVAVLTVDNLGSKTFWKTPDGTRWAFRLEYDLEPQAGERRARVFASDDDGVTWSLFQTTVYRQATN